MLMILASKLVTETATPLCNLTDAPKTAEENAFRNRIPGKQFRTNILLRARLYQPLIFRYSSTIDERIKTRPSQRSQCRDRVGIVVAI